MQNTTEIHTGIRYQVSGIRYQVSGILIQPEATISGTQKRKKGKKGQRQNTKETQTKYEDYKKK